MTDCMSDCCVELVERTFDASDDTFAPKVVASLPGAADVDILNE